MDILSRFFSWCHWDGNCDASPNSSLLRSFQHKYPRSKGISILNGNGGQGRKAQQDKESNRVMENLLAKKAEAEHKRAEAKKMLVEKQKDATLSNCGRK